MFENNFSWRILKKINLKAFLWFWLLSNGEVALHHCSATKTTTMSSSLLIFIQLFSFSLIVTGHWGPLKRVYSS